MSKNKILAVIPARGGSKGIPGKNIVELNGKPLINWTIDSAIKSKYISKIIVSTDDDEIANVSILAGAEVPFIRPHELSTDSASSMSVIKHAVDFMTSQGEIYDEVIMLQPTSPLRHSDDIDKAIELYLSYDNSKGVTLISGFRVDYKFNWLMSKAADKVLFINDNLPTNLSRHELNPVFLPNGAIFIANAGKLQKSFYTLNTIIYEMNSEFSVDIDTYEDLQIAGDNLTSNIEYFR